MTVLSFHIQFNSEYAGRRFVRRIVPLLEIPCLVDGSMIYVCVDIEDFDAVVSYAAQFGGGAVLGPKAQFLRMASLPDPEPPKLPPRSTSRKR